MAVDKLVDSTQLESDLTSVANAIRTKGGTSDDLEFPSGFVTAIGNISGGGITPTGTKSITENGTGIDVASYAYVDVAVPNTYAAGDEGKVVSNGALVSQTSDTVTENDTYDTTLINSLTVNVSGGSGLPSAIDKVDGGTATIQADADTITVSHSLGRVPDFACIYQDIADWTNVVGGHCVIATYIRYPYANSNEAQNKYLCGYHYKHATSGNSLGASAMFAASKASTTQFIFQRGQASWSATDTNGNAVTYRWMVGTFKHA